jgi:hypothetical protein
MVHYLLIAVWEKMYPHCFSDFLQMMKIGIFKKPKVVELKGTHKLLFSTADANAVGTNTNTLR